MIRAFLQLGLGFAGGLVYSNSAPEHSFTVARQLNLPIVLLVPSTQRSDVLDAIRRAADKERK
jgi:hypothetical protein